ncbi:unnamed protein product [Adineta ricciae]|uniref:Uncharacterized protein n=1 Tax=Adineta ricciae TaxID=249248 RepID=A0A815DGZ2_ADIRI|nr:unnamed protein product [Adineta ricciae]CAF1471597.1 unnamed protein product [Adineta ricciae]
MTTSTYDASHEIERDSGSEDDFKMNIDEVYSSDVDSDESNDELTQGEESVNLNWSKTTFEPHLFHFDKQNSGVSSKINAMEKPYSS